MARTLEEIVVDAEDGCGCDVCGASYGYERRRLRLIRAACAEHAAAETAALRERVAALEGGYAAIETTLTRGGARLPVDVVTMNGTEIGMSIASLVVREQAAALGIRNPRQMCGPCHVRAALAADAAKEKR